MFKFDKGPDLAQEFERLVIMRARSKGHQSHLMAEAKRYGSEIILKAASVLNWHELRDIAQDPVRGEQVQVAKNAVAAGTLTDSTWAGALAALSTLQDAWLASLRFQSMIDALVQGGMLNAPPGRKFPIAAAVGTGYSVLDAHFKPLTKFSFDGATTESLKSMGLVVVSNDMLLFGNALAQNAIGSELRHVVSVAADQRVIAVLIDTITPITSSGDVRLDLQSAFNAVSLGQSSRPIIFASPELTKQIALDGTSHGAPAWPEMNLVQGGSIGGVNVLPIDALTDYSSLGDCLMVVDATQLAGSAGNIDIIASAEADILMDDAASAAASVVSMYQTNSTALLCERWFNVERPRASAVAIVKNCDYSSASP